MGVCPYGACEECQLFSTPPAECHFWSPLKKTCIMSSMYEEDTLEDLYHDHQRRVEKLKSNSFNPTMKEFLSRVEELKMLKRGWLDGDGETPSIEAIELVVDEVEKQFNSHPPHLFPMESGGLSLEWFLKDDLCATIEPSLKGVVFGFSGKNFFHREEDWTLEASWTRLKKMIESLT